MFFAPDDLPAVTLPTFSMPALTSATSVIMAVGALGTAAYGLVDATKGLGGGVSTRGLAYIRKSLTPLLPDTQIGAPGSMLSRDVIFEHSNRIGSMASPPPTRKPSPNLSSSCGSTPTAPPSSRRSPA